MDLMPKEQFKLDVKKGLKFVIGCIVVVLILFVALLVYTWNLEFRGESLSTSEKTNGDAQIVLRETPTYEEITPEVVVIDIDEVTVKATNDMKKSIDIWEEQLLGWDYDNVTQSKFWSVYGLFDTDKYIIDYNEEREVVRLNPIDDNNEFLNIVASDEWICWVESNTKAYMEGDKSISEGYNWIIGAQSIETGEVIIIDEIQYEEDDINFDLGKKNTFPLISCTNDRVTYRAYAEEEGELIDRLVLYDFESQEYTEIARVVREEEYLFCDLVLTDEYIVYTDGKYGLANNVFVYDIKSKETAQLTENIKSQNLEVSNDIVSTQNNKLVSENCEMFIYDLNSGVANNPSEIINGWDEYVEGYNTKKNHCTELTLLGKSNHNVLLNYGLYSYNSLMRVDITKTPHMFVYSYEDNMLYDFTEVLLDLADNQYDGDYEYNFDASLIHADEETITLEVKVVRDVGLTFDRKDYIITFNK